MTILLEPRTIYAAGRPPLEGGGGDAPAEPEEDQPPIAD